MITGASGLVGSHLKKALSAAGHDCWSLSRSSGEKTVVWDPAAHRLDPRSVESFQGVFHLAGENIASGRWTDAQKKKIYDSRVKGTELLTRAFYEVGEHPEFFISASAVGYYGDRGDENLDESSRPGEGFLPKTCVDWEAASLPLKDAGVRVAWARIGIVLSTEGGALQKMLLPFRLGLGGKLGSGEQYMSWIHLSDVVSAFVHLMNKKEAHGAYNFCSPKPCRQAEFAKSLASELKRPAIIKTPSFALKAVLGEMADDLLLASMRVQPKRLLESGYTFQFPELRQALKELL